ncbi:MAG: cysteine desulfurase [Proteobacteria bacterium]|nr:cysteine desulfurase [Pseudomonadota bacterium]
MHAHLDCGVHLDWAAGAPLAQVARERMTTFLAWGGGNPSSTHRRGKQARLAVQDAREAVARLIGADPSCVVFTSGATEADNLALRGGAWSAREGSGRRHVLVSAIEHPAVLRAADQLSREGFDIERVSVGRSGVAIAERFAERLRADTALVSLMAVNNEVGTVQPIASVAALAHQAGALFHCDAVQAVGWQALDVLSLGVDLLTVSSHKLGGPPGVGALYVREGLDLVPQVVGGEQENRRRAGTENVLGIVGLGAVADQVARERGAACQRLRDLERQLVEGVLARVPRAARLGDPGAHAPHIACFLLDDVDGETLLFSLDMAGIAASSGAACASRSLEPSPTLLAMGLARAEASSALRLSWGCSTTDGDVARLLEALPRLVEQNRAASRRASRVAP